MDIRPVDLADDALLARLYEIDTAASRLGREEMPHWSRDAFVGALRSPDEGERMELVAAHLPDGRVTGWAVAYLFLLDNREKAWLEVEVDPAHARQGFGSALLEHLVAIATADGRTTVLIDAKVPADRVADHGYRRFAERHGFAFSNVEVVRHADVPVPDETLDAWEQRAVARGAGRYELRTLVNELPPEISPGLADLMSLLAVDAPTGEVDFEVETMTPQRMEERLAMIRAMGRDRLETVALAEDGTVAAQTTLVAPALTSPDGPPAEKPDQPDSTDAWQWGTFVHRDHRGHSLGLAVKTANLRALQARHPDVRRITTQNAETNAWMIAINELMGFEAVEASLELVRRA